MGIFQWGEEKLMKNNNERVEISESCTGCGVCEYICPVKAITMVENDEGFYFPVVSVEKCVKCGLCNKICPQENSVTIKDKNRLYKAYASQIKDRSVLTGSTSGGFFSALAIEVIKSGGVVFGVTMNESQHAEFCEIRNIDELRKIQGSKYVLCSSKDIYMNVYERLEEGKIVLFSGCPCQVAALRAYLQKDYQNLLTVDVICHGAPSQKLFDVYIKALSEQKKARVSNFKFRDKSKYGWGVYWSYSIKNRTKRGGMHDNPYISTFIDGSANRECCYNCKYIGVENRMGDFTLGDYWGVDRVHPEFASRDGVSAVLLNTDRAEEWFKKAVKHCRYIESDIKKISKYNPSLVKSVKRPTKRDTIYKGINEKSASDYINHNLRVPFKRILKTKARLVMPYRVRVIIKRLKPS